MDWTPIITSAITTVGVLIGIYITYLTREIHTAVNSERTKSIETTAALNVELRRLAETNARLTEALEKTHIQKLV
jgi:hypothetical protein